MQETMQIPQALYQRMPTSKIPLLPREARFTERCTIQSSQQVALSKRTPRSITALLCQTLLLKKVRLKYAIIGEDTVVHANSKIGDNPEFYEKNKWGIAVVGKDREVPQNEIILPKEVY